jgi:large subunit ribosomal protein L4
MVKVPCYDGEKGKVAQVEVDGAVFGELVRKRLVRQALIHYAAARRAGTHSTLTRAEVKHNQRKPWKQKGTGRARAGDFASPLWRGGGIVFGPKPRKYGTKLTRGMRREALRDSLLAKLLGDEFKLFEKVSFDAPKTKRAIEVLRALGVAGKRSVIVIAERGENFVKSFRNIEGIDFEMASDLNADHVVRADQIVMDRRAFDRVVERLQVQHA